MASGNEIHGFSLNQSDQNEGIPTFGSEANPTSAVHIAVNVKERYVVFLVSVHRFCIVSTRVVLYF